MRLQGLRTVIYPAAELEAATAWWSSLLDQEPYFKEPFYVGFEVGGDELGLLPDGSADDGAQVYWGVDDMRPSTRRSPSALRSSRHRPTSAGTS